MIRSLLNTRRESACALGRLAGGARLSGSQPLQPGGLLKGPVICAEAGMTPYAPRQPLGMDDLTSIRMGGKGGDFAGAPGGSEGGAEAYDGGKRGKGAPRRMEDGRKGRQAVPPGRQGMDPGQSALEHMGPDGLRQMLITTLESLYEENEMAA